MTDEYNQKPLHILYSTLLFCEQDVLDKDKALKDAETARHVAGVRFSNGVLYKLRNQYPDYDHQDTKLTKFSFSHNGTPIHYVLEKSTCKQSIDQPKVLS